MANLHKPLVSIGIPTYNRIQLLQRTLSSLASQSYENIEIIISDNASNDGTEQMVNRWKDYDQRLVYVKHPINRGVYGNYDACRLLAMGRYFIWIKPGEVVPMDMLASYVSFLESHPDYVSVFGNRDSWDRPEDRLSGETFSLEDEHPGTRVRNFYSKVKQGTLLYGLHRNIWIRKTPIRLNLVGDWHFIAGLAYRGKVKILPGQAHLSGGEEEHIRPTPLTALVKIHGFSWWWRRIPSIRVGLETFWAIAYSFPVYRSLSLGGRYRLGLQSAYKVWAQQQRSPKALLQAIVEPILAKMSYLFAGNKVKELRSKSL